MSDYRPPVSTFTATWELPEGYYVGSIQFRRHIQHSPITVYLCYEVVETLPEIPDRTFLISAGYTGDGDNFLAALAAAKEKVDAALVRERRKRIEFVNNPSPVVRGIKPEPKPTGPLPQIDGLKFDL